MGNQIINKAFIRGTILGKNQSGTKTTFLIATNGHTDHNFNGSTNYLKVMFFDNAAELDKKYSIYDHVEIEGHIQNFGVKRPNGEAGLYFVDQIVGDTIAPAPRVLSQYVENLKEPEDFGYAADQNTILISGVVEDIIDKPESHVKLFRLRIDYDDNKHTHVGFICLRNLFDKSQKIATGQTVIASGIATSLNPSNRDGRPTGSYDGSLVCTDFEIL